MNTTQNNSEQNKVNYPVYTVQENWFKLIEELGSEDAARAYVVKTLRDLADHLESKKYPDIFGVQLDWEKNRFKRDTFIGDVCVTLSHLWPG